MSVSARLRSADDTLCLSLAFRLGALARSLTARARARLAASCL